MFMADGGWVARYLESRGGESDVDGHSKWSSWVFYFLFICLCGAFYVERDNLVVHDIWEEGRPQGMPKRAKGFPQPEVWWDPPAPDQLIEGRGPAQAVAAGDGAGGRLLDGGEGHEEARAEQEGRTVPAASSSPSGPVGPELFPAAAEEEEERGRGAGQGEGEQGLASPMAQARAALDRVVVVPPQVPNRADLCCPLTGELLLCPVRLADGSVYERAKIKEHLNLCHTAERPCISPRSGQELTSLVILPATDIKAQVQQYLRPQTV